MTMVVAAPILDDLPTPEQPLQEFECGPRRCGLGDRELVLDLPAEEAPGISHDRDREAALAVNEPDDPLLDAWPFLLIVRTGRIVTVHAVTLQRGRDRQYRQIHRSFQHIADCTSTRRRVEGQHLGHVPGFYLSTVIVTAAVYWRLGSELRPASRANPSP